MKKLVSCCLALLLCLGLLTACSGGGENGLVSRMKLAPEDRTGYRPTVFSWEIPVDRTIGQNAMALAGKYVREDGNAVLYIDYEESNDYFIFELFVLSAGAKEAFSANGRADIQHSIATFDNGLEREDRTHITFEAERNFAVRVAAEIGDFFSPADGLYLIAAVKYPRHSPVGTRGLEEFDEYINYLIYMEEFILPGGGYPPPTSPETDESQNPPSPHSSDDNNLPHPSDQQDSDSPSPGTPSDADGNGSLGDERPVVPPTVNTVGNTSGNIVSNGMAAVQGDWIYYRSGNNGGKLCAMMLDGSHKQVLCDDDVWDINVVGEWIYYCSGKYGCGDIYKIKIDGTGRQRLSGDDVEDATYLQVVDGWMYYYNSKPGSKALYAMSIDGSEIRKVSKDGQIYGFIVVGDNIYYGNAADHYRLYTMKTDGSGITKLTEDSADYCVESEGYLFYCNSYSNGGDEKIYRIKPDGSDRQKLNDDVSSYINICDGMVYYCNSDENRAIYTMMTDGTARRKLNGERSALINIAGDWIIFEAPSQPGADPQYFIMQLDGSEKRLLD